MNLKIKVNDNNYFKTLLLLLKEIEPFSTLRNRELEVFAELLRYNYVYRQIPYEDRMLLIFSYDIRLKIADNLNIGRDSLYNIMKDLRAKGFITKTEIADIYLKALVKHDELVFSFDFEANG